MDGVQVVEEDGLVAVLHADPEVAAAALGRLRPEWNAAPPGADTEGIFDHLVQVAPEPQVKAVKGDVEAARAAASHGHRGPIREGLRGPRPHRAPHGDGGDEGREAHGVVVDPGALPHSGRAHEGHRPRRRARAGDHTATWAGASAGRAPGSTPRRRRAWPGPRAAGAGGLHPGRGVLLRHPGPGLRGEDRLGRGRRRPDDAVGLRGLLRRRPGGGAQLRRPQHPACGCMEAGRSTPPTIASASVRGGRRGRT